MSKNSSLKKVIISIGFLVISLVLVVSVSYAWFSMSGSPEATGISIRLGGSQTIQIAPDIAVEQDGETLHYPGAFSENLHISGQQEYAYLQELAGLVPVSTADGLYWFVPDDTVDERYRTLDDYEMDDVLAYGNLSKDTEDIAGHYVYLDFWVVAPMDDCELRVSTGTDGQGSYLIALPEIADPDAEEWQLSVENNEAANCARVGFMTNTLTVDNGSMEAYIESSYFAEKYTKLAGIYQEPGIPALNYEPDQKFTIYEPNGEAHTGSGFSYVQTSLGSRIVSCTDGEYLRTQPIGYENGKTVLADISDRLFVQQENVWRSSSSSTLLNEVFQGYVHQHASEGVPAETFLDAFYENVVQGQFSAYLTPGLFYPVTENLYSFGADNGDIPVTAVEDAVLVTLEKNVPQRIRMYVWLEGQDVDCVREAALDSFALGLEFAGSTE